MDDPMDFRITRLEAGFQTLSDHVSKLDNDIHEIREKLSYTATKADVAEIGAKIDQSINGLLRDALNAIPGKQAATWGIVSAICLVGTLLVSILAIH